nr:MAG TPA: hypothetical protein [Caudoviricetes sp.]
MRISCPDGLWGNLDKGHIQKVSKEQKNSSKKSFRYDVRRGYPTFKNL